MIEILETFVQLAEKIKDAIHLPMMTVVPVVGSVELSFTVLAIFWVIFRFYQFI